MARLASRESHAARACRQGRRRSRAWIKKSPDGIFSRCSRTERMGRRTRKKCRGPCGAPAGVRPCASKERRGGHSDQRGAGVRHGIEHGRRGFRAWDAIRRRLTGRSRGFTSGRRGSGRKRIPEPRRFSPKWDGVSRAACGGYAHGTAGGEMVLRREQLRCCATRPLREGEEPMLGYEEKLERLELLDAVADAGRLAKGLDQLLESLAHADQRTRSTSRASWP